jgi:hypothetical protein
MSSIVKHGLAAAILALTTNTAVAVDTQARLAPVYERLESEGERNAVLNQMELGARAYELKDYETATRAFDFALNQIESFYSNKEGAEQARSLWYEEGRKDFKGEPYERVMAYYYRGLLYLQEQDWGNARASFEGGMLQDAFAEEDQNRFDFALMAYLSAWASFRESNDVMQDRALKELAVLRKDVPAFGKGHNTLLVVETGTSPRKLGDGIGHYELVYRRGRKFDEERVAVVLGGKETQVYPMEDVFWQATSRGGRAVDRIVKGKASFRSTNAGVGGVLADTASTLQILQPISGSLGAVAGTLGAIGAMQMFVASKVNAKADVRYWSSLPDAVHVMSLKSSPRQTATVQFFDKAGTVLPELTQTVTMPDNGGVVWVRSRPSGTMPRHK